MFILRTPIVGPIAKCKWKCKTVKQFKYRSVCMSVLRSTTHDIPDYDWTSFFADDENDSDFEGF